MGFKDGKAKDRGLVVMRCTPRECAQILLIKYALLVSVKEEREKSQASSGGQG